MPRFSPDHVPTYRSHKRSGQAVVTLSGRDHQLGPFGSHPSKVRYHELIHRWLAGGRKPLDVKPPRAAIDFEHRMTVDELLDAHVRHSHSYYVDLHR